MRPITSLTPDIHDLLRIPESNLDRGKDKDLKSLSPKKVLLIVKRKVKRIEDEQGIHVYLIIDQHIVDMQNLLESELHTLHIQDTPQRKRLNLSTIDMHNHISVNNSQTIILILTMILLSLKLVLSIIQNTMVQCTCQDMLHMAVDIEDHRIDIQLGTRGIE